MTSPMSVRDAFQNLILCVDNFEAKGRDHRFLQQALETVRLRLEQADVLEEAAKAAKKAGDGAA